MSRGEGRKTRSDKKVCVKPVLPVELIEIIETIKYITKNPIKDIGEALCLDALYNKEILESMSEYFKRGLETVNIVFRGNQDNKQFPKRIGGNTDKITIKFKQNDYAYIYDLSYILNISPSRTVAALIQYASTDINVISNYIANSPERNITENQINELKKILKYINNHSEKNHSWNYFLNSCVFSTQNIN